MSQSDTGTATSITDGQLLQSRLGETFISYVKSPNPNQAHVVPLCDNHRRARALAQSVTNVSKFNCQRLRREIYA